MRSYNVIILLLLITLYANSQNENNIHTLSIQPLALVDRTISISYGRKFLPNFELLVNPKIRIATKNSLFANGNKIHPYILVTDPYWYYNSLTLGIGIITKIKNTTFEPIFQYKYAFFKNRFLDIKDVNGDSGDIYEKLDRSYNSLGIIALFGKIRDYGTIRIKLLGGMGYHIRFYNEHIHSKYDQGTHLENIKSNYIKNRLSINLVFEIGFRFK